MNQCAMCAATTDDLTGWHLLQVSTAEFLVPDGVRAGPLTTLYCHDVACRDAWYARAALPAVPVPT